MSRELRGPSWTPARSSAFASIIGVALSGCVFLVDSLPDDTSTTCHLTTPEYETTGACATCITTNCQTPLNACCADSTCQGQLSNVDQCGSYSCSALSSAAGTNATTGALVSCIASSCATICSGIDAGAVDASPTSCAGCETLCTASSDNTSCSCEPASKSEPGNSTSCSTSTIPNAICCASADFPSVSGSSCECDAVSCDDDGAGFCSCQLGGGTGTSNVESCSSTGSGTCCLSADGSICSCNADGASCDSSNETAVDECGPSTMGCSANATRNESVSSCSVFQ